MNDVVDINNLKPGQIVEIPYDKGGEYYYDVSAHNPSFWDDAIVKETFPNDEKVVVQHKFGKYAGQRHFVRITSIRLKNNVSVKQEVKLYSSCVECKEVFIYPVEANCAEGRVCYSCRSSYGWKYKLTG